ncbi:isoleucine--tRNA ligase [Salisediminibacterium halotolerans]|uniref:Isoleucine--tRNA ligase n=1 Tax=Salisediminibacterium halotolerans TaxID=517425 RepID=A0A1H9PWA7_9BACI|nr:isoleucine--tRNA ligase [Salisediminibacterium haloalkalitolerans]SER52408.1 isoleucyl-tRNA synthetase [Salisediminibacterium haloalkalitolerans]
MNYKDTLLMPNTDFPMKGNLPNREPAMQEQWETMNIYEKVQKRTKGRPMFVLHDGPPYANGDIHMGHALNKILKDFIVRYKSMAGFHAPYVPGWDTHGLPIETALTKKGKVDRKKLSIAEFRQKCEEYALEQLDNQREQFKRLGVRGDWDNPYVTLNPEYEAQQIKVFGEMAKRGYIYKGKKPVYWSPSSESALAEAEIEYHDKRSPSIYVTFDVTENNGVLDGDEKYVIWTTTPWTIPANLAIALHPELTYVTVRSGGKKLIVAEGMLEHMQNEEVISDYEVLATYKGADLAATKAKHPFYDRESLVVLGEHVTLDAGTGCVHTAPGHGEDDYVIGLENGLDVLCPVDDRGHFTDEAPMFEGQFYDSANKPITELMNENGTLLKLNWVTHSYPHDWRTKKPVIFRATAQWFASIDEIRDNLLSEIENVTWLPKWGETRLYNMVRDRGDWCISRQRAWGVPIPIFYGEDGEAIISDETINHVSELFRAYGSNVWFERDAKDLLPEGFTSPQSPNGTFTKETDIMDVWFDSGSSHQAVLEERDDQQRPADVYLEGSDQYRGWFNSSLSTSVAVTGKAPYKAVISHGFTLDGEGKKMSKSLGNVIVPNNVMKNLGADIMRLWVSSVDYQADVRVSDAILKQVAEVYRKIRNTLRFLLGNLNDFNPADHELAFDERRELDQYMSIQANELVKSVRKGYDDYQFAQVYNKIHNFCTIELSSFYMDVAKDTLYVKQADHPARRSVQSTMYEILQTLVKLISPILSHTADEVWQHIPGRSTESVQLTDMPEVKSYSGKEDLVQKWDRLLVLRDDVMKGLEYARNEKGIKQNLSASVNLYASEQDLTLLKSFNELHKLFITSGAHLKGTLAEAAEDAVMYDEIAVAVNLAEGEKCPRCWHVSENTGTDSRHPELCPDCTETVINYYENA